MILSPAVIVNGAAEARAALAPGFPVLLLSGENAACYMGVGWWQALIEAARADHLATPFAHALDCGQSAGRALAALRMGQPALVLAPDTPGGEAIARIAAAQNCVLLHERPRALDLGQPGAARRLLEWLARSDTASPLG